MPKDKNKKFNIALPGGMLRDAESIVEKEGSWLSVQEFIRDSIKEKIERWKREHPPKV